MRLTWLALVALACAKSTPPEAAVAPSPDKESSRPSSDGIVAGPRNIVETPPPPTDPDIPGQGPKVAYMMAIRTAMMSPFQACIEPLDLPKDGAPVLVNARIDASGAVVVSQVRKASGNESLDKCALEAANTAVLAAPPAELLNEDGVVVTSDIAFLP